MPRLNCSLGLGAAVVLACTAVVPPASPPPQIYRVLTTPLCARLHERVRPAVALILQTDATIAKSGPLFATYGSAVVSGAAYDSINVQTPQTEMALQRMSYLVNPIAQNVTQAQTMLDDAALQKPTGNAGDDRTLAQLRRQLLETVAFQSASLDLVSGFVATQQMGELQHAGQTYIGAIQGGADAQGLAGPPAPNPLQDPDAPGLSPNPYELNLAAVPGLAVGYNPLSRVREALQWLHAQTGARENAAAATLNAALLECGQGQAAPKRP